MHPIQEHFYHVLENRAPCSNEVIFPDPDPPKLPSPLKPDSQDTSDTHCVYQDINELSCKSNEVVDGKQCHYKEAYA